MGEVVRKLNRAERFVSDTLRNSLSTYAQCDGYHTIDYTEFKRFRAEMKDKGTPVSTTAIFAKSIGLAMKEFPRLNSVLVGDELHTYDEVNVSVGVDSPNGLMLIVVKDTGNRSLFDINDDLRDKVSRGKTGKLTVDDMKDGTITISNLCSSTSHYFNSVLVGGQMLLLGFAAITKQPCVVDDQIVIRELGNVIANMNHSAIQGMIVTQFMGRLKDILEHPYENLL